jgi:hypothetical protein
MASNDITGSHDSKRVRLLLICIGGLLIGIAASFPLGIVWPFPPYPEPLTPQLCPNGGEQIRVGGVIFPFFCASAYMFIQPLVWGSFLLAGALFGLIAQRLAGRGSAALAALTGGVILLVAAFFGGQWVDRIPNPSIPPFEESEIARRFSFMVFGISLLFAAAIGLVLRTPGLWWRAPAAATVTAVTYLLVAVSLYRDAPTPLMDFFPAVERPMGNMMKTVLTSNLLAGTIGGWMILILLKREIKRKDG